MHTLLPYLSEENIKMLMHIYRGIYFSERALALNKKQMNVCHHSQIAFRHLAVFQYLHWVSESYKSRVVHMCNSGRLYIIDQKSQVPFYLFVSFPSSLLSYSVTLPVLLHTGSAKMRQERRVLALQKTYSKVPTRKKKT